MVPYQFDTERGCSSEIENSSDDEESESGEEKQNKMVPVRPMQYNSSLLRRGSLGFFKGGWRTSETNEYTLSLSKPLRRRDI